MKNEIKATLSNLQKEKRNKDGQWNTSNALKSNPACKRGAHLICGAVSVGYSDMLIYVSCCHVAADAYQEIHGDLDSHWWEQKVVASNVPPHIALFSSFLLLFGKKIPRPKPILACFLIFRSFKGGHGAGSLEQYTYMYQVWYIGNWTLFSLQVLGVGHWNSMFLKSKREGVPVLLFYFSLMHMVVWDY